MGKGMPASNNVKKKEISGEEAFLAERKFSVREWEEVFNTVTDPMVIIDKDYNILKANKAVSKEFSVLTDQIINQKCYKIFHKYVGPIDCSCTTLKFSKDRVNASQEICDNKAGKTYLIDIYPRYNKDGSLKYLVHIIKDVTEIRQAEANIKAMAITDFLTGVYNQRHFYFQLEKEIEKIIRYEGTFSLILFDVDGFKEFNDKHGHLEGDNILTKVGEIVRDKIRKTDSAYRYGGDEFVILMPQTCKEKASKMAERLLSSFRKHIHVTQEQDVVHITLSIGVAEYQKGDTLKTIITKVDSAMYMAKKAGGNKIFNWQSV